ncbi:hypothetical protein RIF29_29991 [Crotalaria pallida]|uniref:Uncharacterized protein n=1 Tax=Crotalaria pallida TaxID=3830 RepID=A0AAN9HUD3_CROPI
MSKETLVLSGILQRWNQGRSLLFLALKLLGLRLQKVQKLMVHLVYIIDIDIDSKKFDMVIRQTFIPTALLLLLLVKNPKTKTFTLIRSSQRQRSPFSIPPALRFSPSSPATADALPPVLTLQPSYGRRSPSGSHPPAQPPPFLQRAGINNDKNPPSPKTNAKAHL